MGELESYSRLNKVFSHWIWASGFRKGRRLNKGHAETLLGLDHFDKNMLEPVYIDEPSPLHSESMEIQNVLGDTKVSEYGSFVGQSSESYIE